MLASSCALSFQLSKLSVDRLYVDFSSVSKTSKLTFEDVIAINARLDRFNPNSNIFLDMFPTRVKTELRTKLDTLIESLRPYNIMVVVFEHRAKSIDDDIDIAYGYVNI